MQLLAISLFLFLFLVDKFTLLDPDPQPWVPTNLFRRYYKAVSKRSPAVDPAAAAAGGRSVGRHHAVPGAGGSAAGQLLPLHLPPEKQEGRGVRQLPGHQHEPHAQVEG